LYQFWSIGCALFWFAMQFGKVALGYLVDFMTSINVLRDPNPQAVGSIPTGGTKKLAITPNYALG